LSDSNVVALPSGYSLLYKRVISTDTTSIYMNNNIYILRLTQNMKECVQEGTYLFTRVQSHDRKYVAIPIG